MAEESALTDHATRPGAMLVAAIGCKPAVAANYTVA